MKIEIRPRGVTLTKPQRARLERDLDMVLARLGTWIDRVLVELSAGELEGIKCCEIEVRLRPQIVKVEDSDADVRVAVTQAAKRVARSVSRVLETEGPVRR